MCNICCRIIRFINNKLIRNSSCNIFASNDSLTGRSSRNRSLRYWKDSWKTAAAARSTGAAVLPCRRNFAALRLSASLNCRPAKRSLQIYGSSLEGAQIYGSTAKAPAARGRRLDWRSPALRISFWFASRRGKSEGLKH
nr:hypothetical protein Iba_chr10eCG12940 [Ipomoea batatas]